LMTAAPLTLNKKTFHLIVVKFLKFWRRYFYFKMPLTRVLFNMSND